MNLELKEIKLPDFGLPTEVPEIPSSVYSRRSEEAYNKANVDWLMIYSDREHFGNIYYLSGFEPRFEEALLILGPESKNYLLVGNEGIDYSGESKLEVEPLLTQSFSLMGQDRTETPRIDEVLRRVGVKSGDQVGVVGWKYLEDEEEIKGASNLFVPAFLIEHIESVTNGSVVNSTKVLMNPEDGIRTLNEVEEIVKLEFGAARASRAVQNVIDNFEVGQSEFEAVSNMNYAGEPLSAHIMFDSGKETIVGLRSPSGKIVERGDGATTAIGYWGGLSCRAGSVDEANDEYLEKYAKPYFKAVATWYEEVDIGSVGGEIYDRITEVMAEGDLRPALNPGHLTSMDEWLHTFVRPGSTTTFKSGMAVQLDIIPAPMPDGIYLNCEDSVAFADEELRQKIAEQYPEVWERIKKRRQFLIEEIGLNISDNLLPLANNPGYFSPFWLESNKVLTVVK